MTENELCNLVIKYSEDYGFRAFAEYDGWDIVLERKGVIFGVQAKLELNKKVIAQCLRVDNVHFKVIVLPTLQQTSKLDPDLELIAHSLKLLVFAWGVEQFDFLGWEKTLLYYRQQPYKLLKVPEFDYVLPAGVRSPKTVSEKKIAYCKLEKIARAKGFVTVKDAQDIGVWIPNLYFRFDPIKRVWFIRNSKPPSLLWPHIWENLS